jgi:hypothetical protein
MVLIASTFGAASLNRSGHRRSNEPTCIARLSIDVIKLAVSRRRLVAGVTSLVEDQCALCLAFFSFASTPAVKANHQADEANV